MTRSGALAATLGSSKKRRAGLRSATFSYVEAQLHDYHQLVQRLDELRRDIAERGMGISYDTQSHHQEASPEWSDPTSTRAGQMMTNRALNEVAKTVTAIQIVHHAAGLVQRQVMELYYYQRMDRRRVAERLGITDRTLFTLRQEIVLATAQQLGLW